MPLSRAKLMGLMGIMNRSTLIPSERLLMAQFVIAR